MTGTRYWWPLELSDELENALALHKDELSKDVVPFDTALAERVDRLLIGFMDKPVRKIIARDSLPYLGHAFVGWGNATVDGQALLDRIASFVHLDKAGKPYIYQCHPEGDYHPWQTFAYTMMAGVDPSAKVGTLPYSLREIAENSTVIRTSAMDDLGHLMFASAALGMPSSLTCHFNGTPLNLAQMVDKAIHAHHFGPFYVCRKFHLTEGLCAVAATYPELAEYKPVAQKFLDGQLEVMLTLSLLIRQLELVASGAIKVEDSRIAALRKAMLIGTLLENHIYSAGHVIELASLTMRMGYPLSTTHIGAIHHILNHLNGAISRAFSTFSPTAAFLPLGHYRRALTLYSALHADAAGSTNSRAALTKYWANFDTCEQPVFDERTDPIDALYTKAVHAPGVRPFFQDVLDEFAQGNATGMELYGGFNHFRRLHPEGWPRQLHFEFLDYGDKVGVELHFENPDLLPLMDAVSIELPRLKEMFQGVSVEGLRRTDRTEAKIRLWVEESYGAVGISRLMQDFVAHMEPIISAELVNPAHGIQRSRKDIALA
jgi:hypothetical protein